jgi:hypothetical protein
LAVKMGAARRGGEEGGAHPDAERIRVLKDYATRAAQQLGSKLDGTVHCELLDYYACIMLQQHFAALHIAAPLPPPMLRADVVDIAKGYYVAALRHLRPEITIESVAAHASAVFPQLRAIAAERSPPLRRALEDGEAFDAAVHVWDVDATREDWASKYTAAYKGAPPIITRYSVMAAAQAALEERERLSNAAVRDKRCVLHYIGDRVLCSNGCGALIWPGEAMLCCRGGKHILGEDLNPPIRPEFMRVLEYEGFSADSRSYNGNLSFATTGTSPTRAQGGFIIIIVRVCAYACAVASARCLRRCALPYLIRSRVCGTRANAIYVRQDPSPAQKQINLRVGSQCAIVSHLRVARLQSM